MFAMFDNHHHGATHVGVWLAMPLGAQEALVYQDPKRFFVPPYVGPRGWVGVRLDNQAGRWWRRSSASPTTPSRTKTLSPGGG